MFNSNNKQLNQQIAELKSQANSLVKQLDYKTLRIDQLNQQIDSLIEQLYSSHLNCSVVIDWQNINAVSVRRMGKNITRVTYKKPDGIEYSSMDIECNVDTHEELAVEFAEHIAI